ncbi:MAG TPA: DNA cytosine methyltransferase [Thermoanaerobaculia bacterium]|nr:DNA cytosine methyltransferase [Thermoanaerobaculia bacterium]
MNEVLQDWQMMSLKTFLKGRENAPKSARAGSVFSGAGLSDIGYARAGFDFAAHVELDARRSEIGMANFPDSIWLEDARHCHAEFIDACGAERLDILSATPPCQGLSSSNPTRGRRRTPDEARNRSKNLLLLETIPLVSALQPRVFVVENVRQALTLPVGIDRKSIVETLAARLPNYHLFQTVINVADYGVPQARLRAVIVGVHRDERWLKHLADARVAPWPRRTHSSDGVTGKYWLTVGEFFHAQRYEALDAADESKAVGVHPLHRVPVYERDRYLQVSSIPANSGRSAYENDGCPSCEYSPVPVGRVYCPECRRAMRNRPYVVGRGGLRLIRGFHSSYRRMSPDEPAPTIMTSSGRVGSDYKIHPWEHRVLSILECADLQSVPRNYDWSGALNEHRFGLIREVIGEALPPYFTYLHGRLLLRLIRGECDVASECEPNSGQDRAKTVRRVTVSRSHVLTGRQLERPVKRARQVDLLA